MSNTQLRKLNQTYTETD